jgi:hypothetical protein
MLPPTLLSVSLSACATSPAELRRAGPDHVGAFAVPQDDRSTYNLLLERQRACEQAGGWMGRVHRHGKRPASCRPLSLRRPVEAAFTVRV